MIMMMGTRAAASPLAAQGNLQSRVLLPLFLPLQVVMAMVMVMVMGMVMVMVMVMPA